MRNMLGSSLRHHQIRSSASEACSFQVPSVRSARYATRDRPPSTCETCCAQRTKAQLAGLATSNAIHVKAQCAWSCCKMDMSAS